MVFGACATYFIKSCSTDQCALCMVTGTRTKFVDSCQKQMVHHDHGETSAKSPVGMVMSPLVYFLGFVRLKAGLDQNAEDICTVVENVILARQCVAVTL